MTSDGFETSAATKAGEVNVLGAPSVVTAGGGTAELLALAAEPTQRCGWSVFTPAPRRYLDCKLRLLRGVLDRSEVRGVKHVCDAARDAVLALFVAAGMWENARSSACPTTMLRERGRMVNAQDLRSFEPTSIQITETLQSACVFFLFEYLPMWRIHRDDRPPTSNKEDLKL